MIYLFKIGSKMVIYLSLVPMVRLLAIMLQKYKVEALLQVVLELLVRCIIQKAIIGR